jgi:hypothetical protein
MATVYRLVKLKGGPISFDVVIVTDMLLKPSSLLSWFCGFEETVKEFREAHETNYEEHKCTCLWFQWQSSLYSVFSLLDTMRKHTAA